MPPYVGNPSVRMRLLRQRSARSSSFIARKPPMLASPSFLAERVAPSESENISRAISRGDLPPCPGSRRRMNQAFSAKRHASDGHHDEGDARSTLGLDEAVERLDVQVALEGMEHVRMTP